MLKVTNTEVTGFEAAIRGMRNPKNSWDKMDSYYDADGMYHLGPNDLKLATRLSNATDDHSKFLRMITVTCDITAPHFWWPEMDTYKIGTVRDSCSKMHTLLDKPFEASDFTTESIFSVAEKDKMISHLNWMREQFLLADDAIVKQNIWRGILEQLPLGYNQKSTWQGNYQVLRRIYHARKNHKLSEWHTFCAWICQLPYAKELMQVDKE